MSRCLVKTTTTTVIDELNYVCDILEASVSIDGHAEDDEVGGSLKTIFSRRLCLNLIEQNDVIFVVP